MKPQHNPRITNQKCINFFRGITFFVSICSILQGFQNIAKLGTFMYQKEQLFLKPETISIISAFVCLPYAIKPVFGYFMDWLSTKLSRIKYIVFVTCLVK